MSDLLDMDYINSLPQDIWAKTWHGSWWPVNDFEVQTGLLRIDVCGKLEVKHIDDIREFRDGSGKLHSTFDFYANPEYWEGRAIPASNKEQA